MVFESIDKSLDFENEDLTVEDDNLIGVAKITDGSGLSKFEDSVLIYNENFGRALDTAANGDWTETIAGAGAKSQTGGILTLDGGGIGGSIKEKNNAFTVDVTGKSKKIRFLTKMQYSGTDTSQTFFGMQSASNYLIYFLKGTGNTGWRGYITDEATNEYFTDVFTVTASADHIWEIVFNSNRADFYIDGVRKGSLIQDISVADANVFFSAGENVDLLIDHVRVWESIIPK